jgi:hypothetical protein
MWTAATIWYLLWRTRLNLQLYAAALATYDLAIELLMPKMIITVGTIPGG